MSLYIDIKRIFREGIIIFWRNKLISFVSMLMMVITLFLTGVLILFNAGLGFSVAQLQDRVDVNIYFFPEVSERVILDFQSRIEVLDIIKDIQYESKEESLEKFVQRHEDDYLVLQSLEELDKNPLGATLNIRAYDPSQYENITKFIESDSVSERIVEKVNYYQNKNIIDRLNSFINSINSIGFGVTLLFFIISLFIIFNTMRLTIFSWREEIEIKKLVGAENRYIRGPFLIVGLLYGLFSSIIAMTILYPLTYWFGNLTETFFGGMDIFSYYFINFLQIFLILFAIGIFLGIISSWFAVGKYLRR